MSRRALILTYHAIEPGPPPLRIDPRLFDEHLAVLAESGAEALTVAELAARVGARRLERPAFAITFDDGFTSVVREALPLLAERGLPATVFCVAGHLGGASDWPTQPPDAPRLPLASAGELTELARGGIEIGSHGMEHLPLDAASEDELRRELTDSKARLEQATGTPVTSFACPYGVRPSRRGRELLEVSYSAACTGGMSYVTPSSERFELPRVDAHYVRGPELLRRALDGSADAYLRARRIGARIRRAVRADYVRA